MTRRRPGPTRRQSSGEQLQVVEVHDPVAVPVGVASRRAAVPQIGQHEANQVASGTPPVLVEVAVAGIAAAVAVRVELHVALAFCRDHFGERHPEVARSLHDLGRLSLERGDLDLAERRFRDAASIYDEALGETSPEAIEARLALAEVLDEAGETAEARSIYEAALVVLRQKLPDDRPHLASALTGLGELLLEHVGEAEAEPILREALAIRREVLSPYHWRVAVNESLLGDCLARRGNDEEARPLLESGHRRLVALFGEDDPRVVAATRRLDARAH